jgi:hypothetical protein
MREILQEIVSFQKKYSSSNTPAMQRRGRLIRDVLPHELGAFAAPLRAAMGAYGEDAKGEGSDGTGQKAWVPWARWYSTSRSPSAQVGWYVVYLFHPDASGVSLCLSHGSTQMLGNAYVPRSDAEVARLMTWAPRVIGNAFADDPAVRRGIELGREGLSGAYERTTVFSKFYVDGAIPEDWELERDLLRFVRPLATLYRAAEQGQEPGSQNPEVAAARAGVETVANPGRRSGMGQGRGLSAELRKLVELEAMTRARAWLLSRGFTFRDVSARECCDFRAQHAGEEWVIEVKGTTGGLKSVLLTPNEVDLHRASFPRNVLIVVHGLSISVDGKHATGGELVAYFPWQLKDDRLSAVGYEYRLD